jgi:hypothetical protein
MKKITLFVFLMMASTAFAETKSGTTEVQKDIKIPVPGLKEDVVVEVPYIVEEVREVTLPKSNVTHHYGNSFQLRGGLTVGAGFPARKDPSLTVGLTGQVGKTDSPWALQADFRAGNCKGGLALNSGLGVTRLVRRHFRAGLGADLLYCSDVNSHPKEMATERIVGGSLRLQVEEGHLSLSVLAGVGRADHQIPDGRAKEVVLYQELAVAYHF